MKNSYKDVKQIFESPDGGKTVYAREFGSPISERRLIQGDSEWGKSWNFFLNNRDWNILAEEYPSIKEKLEELKVLESLCRK